LPPERGKRRHDSLQPESVIQLPIRAYERSLATIGRGQIRPREVQDYVMRRAVVTSVASWAGASKAPDASSIGSPRSIQPQIQIIEVAKTNKVIKTHSRVERK
jgi:hypothetical protein